MAEQYAYQSTQLLPAACVVDITPPTFAGIQSVSNQSNGSILASWNAATDTSNPIDYVVYVQHNTATGLFNPANVAYTTRNLSILIFQLADSTLLLAGENYYIGVRAKDALNNEETNTVSLQGTSTGVLTNNLSTIANQLVAAINALPTPIQAQISDDGTLDQGSDDSATLVGYVKDTDDLTGDIADC
jgi:hypothetical protein